MRSSWPRSPFFGSSNVVALAAGSSCSAGLNPSTLPDNRILCVNPAAATVSILSGPSATTPCPAGYMTQQITITPTNPLSGTAGVTAASPGTLSTDVLCYTSATAAAGAGATVAGAAPTISNVTPFGVAGSPVTIYGTNFTGVSSVTLSGIPAQFVVNNSTQITATLPAGVLAGLGVATVTTPYGTANSALAAVPPGTGYSIIGQDQLGRPVYGLTPGYTTANSAPPTGLVPIGVDANGNQVYGQSGGIVHAGGDRGSGGLFRSSFWRRRRRWWWRIRYRKRRARGSSAMRPRLHQRPQRSRGFVHPGAGRLARDSRLRGSVDVDVPGLGWTGRDRARHRRRDRRRLLVVLTEGCCRRAEGKGGLRDMMREDLWRRALGRTGRPVRANYSRGDCGFTANEEHEIKGLMRRVRDGVLTRACLKRDLDLATDQALRISDLRDPRIDQNLIGELTSRITVLEHVLDMLQAGGPRDRAERSNRPVRSNPQLQVLGNGTDVMPERVERSLRKFHGTEPNGTLLRKFSTDDGSDAVIDLGYLGDCPGVAWLSDEKGSSNHDLLVEKSHVRFNGFHRLFHGDQPRLDLIDDPSIHPDEQLACIVGGEVRKLKERCGDNGVLGPAPIVEYTVERIKNSNKAKSHWVHTYDKPEPILVWNDRVNGLVYERDRSIAGLTGISPYCVKDWFED